MQRDIKGGVKSARKMTENSGAVLDLTERLAGSEAEELRAKLKQTVNFLRKNSARTALALKITHKFIRRNPYAALGIGIGLGLLLGFTMHEPRED